ncbi:MAG TPA: amylo-alpha-1,6-glucosidase [Candidatus Humimicrobiaceae bacterium]|nr:amylo-alpha-1,6-glucosidase [Candidatus Humimicrobiaceae bacterium]
MRSEGEIKKQLLKEIKTLKDRKGFLKAGIPRFERLFGRDSLISAWQLLDWNPGIAKATLEILSHLQGEVINNEREEEPGKILHETDLEKNRHPEGHFPFPYYGSIDSTPLYLIVFSFYFKKTRDRRFLESRWENILMALNWMTEYGDKDKDYFLEYQRKNPKGLFHQGWKDGFEDRLKIEPPSALVEVQGYQYLALKKIADLAEIRKDFELAKKLRKRAEILKEEFNKKFWMETLDLSSSLSGLKASYEKYFALALDGKKKQRKAITSNPGHLLFTGIIQDNKIDSVVKRLFQEDMWTSFGIRTHSTKEPDFDPKSYQLGSIWPHDNWIIAQGLKNLGRKSEYRKIKNAILLAEEKIGYLPEFYGVIDGKITLAMEKTVCYPQAWALGALLDFLLGN